MRRPFTIEGHAAVRHPSPGSRRGGGQPVAHLDDGTPLRSGTEFGRAMCRCGLLSPVLPSSNARERWHRDHREEIGGAPWTRYDAPTCVLDASTTRR